MIGRNFESPADTNGDNIYEVRLIATDSNGNTDSEDWTVTVTDETEAIAFTIDAIADARVEENAVYTSVTPSLSGDAPVGTVIYSLGGADASSFTVNGATGVVSMIGRNFESPADTNGDNIYELRLIATDSNGNTDSENWTLTVTDETKTIAFTIDAIADASVAENAVYTSVCLLYTSPSPRDKRQSRMPSSA